MKVQIINKNKENVNKVKLSQWVSKISQEIKHQDVLNHTHLKKKATSDDFLLSKKTQKNKYKNKISNKTLLLVFVSEVEIKNLNHQFRNKNKVTDILSFAPVQANSLGELAICMPVVKKNKPPVLTQKQWLYYLILHGILHLLDFDHAQSVKEAKKMYHIQDTLFQNLQKNPLF